ncbi:MAG: extracellular solute-binding protein [Planctomycetota bacterium]|jgi:DNA-binding LacI/PurR family transcriptional regulator/ABC-type glycerol-3-phosphate transport system substrate-binding protein|nr:extracellular solute-binding protein [Planctomycetota bacterium]
MALQATMKDVAEAAGVSVGTVSNVLKGDRRVSLSMVQRVQAAIRKTGYRAHFPARSGGKARKTRCIGVVLPSVQDATFAGIYAGVNQVLSENGYVVQLCTTSEIQAREQRAIGQFVKQNAEGIVIVTCQPDSASMFQSVYDNGTPFVFVEREPHRRVFPFVGFDGEKHMRDLVRQLLAEGCRNPLLLAGPRENSSEAGYAAGFLDGLGDRFGGTPRDWLVVETNFNKESAFSALVSRLGVAPPPDVIITTSSQLLAGARQAVKMLELDNGPAFVCLGIESWAPASPVGARVLRRDAMELGESAAALLLGMLSGSDDAKNRRRIVDNARFDADQGPTIGKSVRLRGRGRVLRALMLAGGACSAVEALLPAFQKNSGVRVEIDKRSVVEIGELLRDPARRSQYDIFQVDQPWLGEAAEDGLLHQLDAWLDSRPGLASAWLPGVLDAYCRHGGKCYTVPFLFGAQILFYRKDLFDDPHLKFAFRKRYRYELRAPRNWHEFNQIAAFFTRSLNPDSPTEYGTTLGGQYPNGAVCEFLPRFLSFHEGAFGAGNMLDSLASREAEAALANYAESYRYAPPGSKDFWWDEQAALFGDGQAAMMILFLAHVSSLADRRVSKVVGRIGYDIIPGGKPMLGGWTLGVNRESRSRDSALDFIGWTCDQDLVIPLAILGGAPPANKVYHNSELCALYPWLPKSVESFAKSRERNISKVTTGGKVEERVFENILGGAVYAAVSGKETPAEALRNARIQLERLIGG